MMIRSVSDPGSDHVDLHGPLMAIISRGFRGKREVDPRIPPGQYLERGFPVLSAGPTPRADLSTWTFSITSGGASRASWTWAELTHLPHDDIVKDIHCVTKWSKLDSAWRGISLDTLLDGVEVAPEEQYAMAHCDGGYTTNVPLADLRGGKAGSPTSTTVPPAARARRPGPAAHPPPVLLEVRQVGAQPRPDDRGHLGVLGAAAGTTPTGTRGRNSGTGVTDSPDGSLYALPWMVGTLVARTAETPTAMTLELDVPGWRGALAGQHVDVRLTAEDGYSTQRSYSLASPGTMGLPGVPPDPTMHGSRIALTVQVVDDGEVSPYLTEDLQVGDEVELRGPVGHWFVWQPTDPHPVQLIGGGSGLVPLMSMLRTRRLARSRAPFRLAVSVRTPQDALYADELDALARGRRDHPRVDPAGTRRLDRTRRPDRPRPAAGRLLRPRGAGTRVRLRSDAVRRVGRRHPGRPRPRSRAHPHRTVRPDRDVTPAERSAGVLQAGRDAVDGEQQQAAQVVGLLGGLARAQRRAAPAAGAATARRRTGCAAGRPGRGSGGGTGSPSLSVIASTHWRVSVISSSTSAARSSRSPSAR